MYCICHLPAQTDLLVLPVQFVAKARRVHDTEVEGDPVFFQLYSNTQWTQNKKLEKKRAHP